MGDKLWTSAVTGLRRRGTRLAELHDKVLSNITANAIYEPLLSCLGRADGESTKAELRRLDFDVVGVRVDVNSPVIGFVEAIDLEAGPVHFHVKAIAACDIVPENYSLSEILEAFETKPRLFIAIDGNIEGILTLADLNKPMVRVYLFALISLLEMHMAFWISVMYPHEGWIATLGEERTQKARQENLKRPELSLAECLQFADRRKLVVSSDEIRKHLQLGTRTRSRKLLERAEVLRNDLAHSQYYLSLRESWPQKIGVIRGINDLILNSDQLVEDRAEAMSHDNEDRVF